MSKDIKNTDQAEKRSRNSLQYKTLTIRGEKYRTLYTSKFANRKKWEKPNEKHILSYIPGTIDKIYVKEGDKVLKGDKILVLEAMKMQNTIEFPMDGVVKKINVKTGEKVPKGHVMVEFQ